MVKTKEKQTNTSFIFSQVSVYIFIQKDKIKLFFKLTSFLYFDNKTFNLFQ